MAAFGAGGIGRGGAEVVVAAPTAAAAYAQVTAQSEGARKEQPPQTGIKGRVHEEAGQIGRKGSATSSLGLPKMLGGTSMAQ